MTDHDTLTALNTDYINSVQNGDVKRFDEILAPEFYCTNPDGSFVDRAGFLAHVAKPVEPSVNSPIRKAIVALLRRFD